MLVVKVVVLVDVRLAAELVPGLVEDVVGGVDGAGLLQVGAVTVVDPVVVVVPARPSLLAPEVEGSGAVLPQPHHLDVADVRVISHQQAGVAMVVRRTVVGESTGEDRGEMEYQEQHLWMSFNCF